MDSNVIVFEYDLSQNKCNTRFRNVIHKQRDKNVNDSIKWKIYGMINDFNKAGMSLIPEDMNLAIDNIEFDIDYTQNKVIVQIANV